MIKLLSTRHWFACLTRWSHADRRPPLAYIGRNPSRNGVEVNIKGRGLLVAHVA